MVLRAGRPKPAPPDQFDYEKILGKDSTISQ